MNKIDTLLIRFALAIIMMMHSVPSFITMEVLNFGSEFLAHKGFGTFGIPLAIFIKLIQLLSIPALILDKYLKLFSVLNICILLTGIIMIHYNEGWYVVGGGSNGVEFNFLLIFIFLSFIIPDGILIRPKNKRIS
jgi:putative oxidoreductase